MVTVTQPEISKITAESLGSQQFKEDYGIRYAYITGSMYKGIASTDLVIAMGRAGMIGYLGTGGLKYAEVEAAIDTIQSALSDGQAYGLNLLYGLDDADAESKLVELYLKRGVHYLEASAYMSVTPALVRFCLSGLERAADGSIKANNHILAKVSRPEVAKMFMSPAPEAMVNALLKAGHITQEQAELGKQVPLSNEVCVEADSGGHTDQGIAYALMPAMQSLRNELVRQHDYKTPIRIGAAGGIGTPESAAAAFVMGADFVLTGSINQCTVEAGMSDAVKDLLQDINVQDTDYAPAGDMFEIGARVQVMKKGVFFPARGNKLFALYQQHNSLEELDEKTRKMIQEKYFKRSFADVWKETEAYYAKARPRELEKAQKSPKYKMAMIFKWYFIHSARLARSGSSEQKVDYQVHTGPALGAFNQWVKGTELESWRKRHVADIAERLMQGTAEVLKQRFQQFAQ